MGLFNIFKKSDESFSKNEKIVKQIPISNEDKQELIKTLPTFEYHPNVYQNDIVEFKEGICDCCQKQVKAYVTSMYTAEDVHCICMNCIKDGSAAIKFDGEFIQDSQEISDSNKRKVLHCMTPGYVSWQGEYWLACCDDYCEFIGDVGIEELDKFGITNEVIDEFCQIFGKLDSEFLKNNLKAKGSIAGYLFRCKHCNKYHLYVDMN